MDFSGNICLSCCMLHPTSSLTQLTCKQTQFLHTFLLLQDVTSLVICNSCNTKLEEFKQFLDKCKRNINMIKMVRSEQETSKKWSEPDSTWTSQSERKCSTDLSLQISPAVRRYESEQSEQVPTNSITDAKDNVFEEKFRNANILANNKYHKEEKEKKEYKLMKFQKSCQHKITIQEVSSETGSIPMILTPDVSIVMDAANTYEYANDPDELEEPVSPPPSSDVMSTCSILHPDGVPLLIPIVTKYGGQDLAPTHNTYHSVRSLNSNERRRQRNREASRRYREKAREDPELLKKMREQQNARQKKYYARLRMKKQNSEDWDTTGEDGEERAGL